MTSERINEAAIRADERAKMLAEVDAVLYRYVCCQECASVALAALTNPSDQ